MNCKNKHENMLVRKTKEEKLSLQKEAATKWLQRAAPVEAERVSGIKKKKKKEEKKRLFGSHVGCLSRLTAGTLRSYPALFQLCDELPLCVQY